jgi:CheY-like chemotaxis protein
MKKTVPTILHVEDLESDRILVAVAFQRSGLLVDLHSARNEEAALEYLQGTGIYSDRKAQPLPNLVLLDLKLDHRSGAEVLVWIRKQPKMKKLPVVILSSSDQPEDRQQAREAGATDYFCKPVSIDPFRKMVEEIYTRWLS